MALLSSGESAAWVDALLSDSFRTQRPNVMPLAGFIADPDEDGYWRPAGRSDWSHVKLIAIVNRFDLAAPHYRHCGEYRLIFTRRTEQAVRLHIAVGTVLPNPHPERGKAGCADVAAFWQDLARTESAGTRRDRLERFFFAGMTPFRAVLDPRDFAESGRIRTSEISSARPRFRQFELQRECASGRPCVARLIRVPLDNMPDADLFAADSSRARAFRREFLGQVASLAIFDVNRYSMSVDRAYSVTDTDGVIPPFNYRLPFRRSLASPGGREFREQIADELKKAGSGLTPENIIDRAETQNCAGCHGKRGPVGDGLIFPKAFDSGEHLSDESLVGSVRVSPALEEVYLPYRIRLLTECSAAEDQ
ncbi:MAG TPA: hypothetical protein VGF69_16555 [Thermoanaerobaculia bacterium]|jgi:hypothetical protein